MESGRLIELLQPFLRTTSVKALSFRAGVSPEESAIINPSQIENTLSYLDLLLLWNARVNLTAVRKPEEIVTRHFGESLFTARHLIPTQRAENQHLIDVGSGAGFPGLPIKIWAADLRLTLIESNQKKATFLREVVRKLALTNVEVFSERAESYPSHGDVVTLRAVERFEQALPSALRLLRPTGHLAIMIGKGQIARARDLAPDVAWEDPLHIPLSLNRVLLMGELSAQTENQPA
jgi:16S rRNA (guanine527-N7)-methyltransferase